MVWCILPLKQLKSFMTIMVMYSEGLYVVYNGIITYDISLSNTWLRDRCYQTPRLASRILLMM